MPLPRHLITLALFVLLLGVPTRAQVEPVASRSAWRVAPVEAGVALIPLVPAAGTDDPLIEAQRAWAPLVPDLDIEDARLRRLVARAPLDGGPGTAAGVPGDKIPGK